MQIHPLFIAVSKGNLQKHLTCESALIDWSIEWPRERGREREREREREKDKFVFDLKGETMNQKEKKMRRKCIFSIEFTFGLYSCLCVLVYLTNVSKGPMFISRKVQLTSAFEGLRNILLVSASHFFCPVEIGWNVMLFIWKVKAIILFVFPLKSYVNLDLAIDLFLIVAGPCHLRMFVFSLLCVCLFLCLVNF